MFRCLKKKARVLPEASMRAVKTEKLRQLRAGKEKRHATFEAGHNTLRDEMDHDSRFREPGNEGDERDRATRAGREGAKTHRLPPVISPSDEPITSEIAEVTEIAVCREPQKIQKTKPPNKQAYRPASGGKSGKRRVAQGRRKQIRGKRDAGERSKRNQARW